MSSKVKSVALGAVAVAAVVAWIVVGKLQEPPVEPVFGPPPTEKQQPVPEVADTTPKPAPLLNMEEEATPPSAAESETMEELATPAPEEEAGPPEDPVVRLSFVDDLARLTVENYFPAGSHLSAGKKGVLLLSLKTLNMRYGTKLVGLAHESLDLLPARKEIFKYVLNPTVLQLIQAMYADRFVAALQEQAAGAKRTFGKTQPRHLNEKETKEMFGLAAVQAREFGLCLESLAAMEDLAVRVETYLSSVKAALSANEDFREALNRYQELRAQAADAGKLSPDAKRLLNTTRIEMEQVGDEYSQSLARRERLKTSLAGRIKRDSGITTLSEGETLYAAQWVYRRLRENPDYREAVATAGLMLKDLSTTLEAQTR